MCVFSEIFTMSTAQSRLICDAVKHFQFLHITLHLPLILYHTFRVKWNVKVITWTKIDNRGTEDRNKLDQEQLYL